VQKKAASNNTVGRRPGDKAARTGQRRPRWPLLEC